MASRKTIRINFMGIPSQLKELVSEIPDHAQFIKRHGYLLDLVIPGFEEDMMHVLFQFFDPKRHCFTFPNYQLVPILEEFSKLLGVPILDQMPFTGLEKVPKYEDIASALHLERCGEFPNVPLLGIRGGITYKPSLALRQFGFARRDGPHDMLLQDIVFDYNHDLQNYRRRFIHAWG